MMESHGHNCDPIFEGPHLGPGAPWQAVRLPDSCRRGLLTLAVQLYLHAFLLGIPLATWHWQLPAACLLLQTGGQCGPRAALVLCGFEGARCWCQSARSASLWHSDCFRRPNTKGYSSTYLAMGFANVRAGTWYPPEH